MKLVKSEVASKAVEIGRKNRKTFRPLEARGVLAEPVYREQWWFVPIAEDKSVIPQEALYRVELLQKAGIPMKDLIVAHQAPLALMAPKRAQEIDHHKREVASGIAQVLMYLVIGVGLVIGGLPLLVLSAVFVDPALIVVLSTDDPETDGMWLEVCAWDESFG